MENVLNAAFYIYYMYLQKTGQILDEMKLHKLLYFSQRESLVGMISPYLWTTFKAGNMVLYAFLLENYTARVNFKIRMNL